MSIFHESSFLISLLCIRSKKNLVISESHVAYRIIFNTFYRETEWHADNMLSGVFWQNLNIHMPYSSILRDGILLI